MAEGKNPENKERLQSGGAEGHGGQNLRVSRRVWIGVGTANARTVPQSDAARGLEKAAATGKPKPNAPDDTEVVLLRPVSLGALKERNARLNRTSALPGREPAGDDGRLTGE